MGPKRKHDDLGNKNDDDVVHPTSLLTAESQLSPRQSIVVMPPNSMCDSNASSGEGSSNPLTTLNQGSNTRDLLSADEHKKMDAAIERFFLTFLQSNQEPGWAALLSFITMHDDRLITLKLEAAEELLRDNPAIEKVLAEAWRDKSFKQVRQLEILWPKLAEQTSDASLEKRSDPLSGQERKVTEQSWAIPFVGNASANLLAHLSSMLQAENFYAKYTSIVQSSGMGKSRAVDELSKTYLVVPINLRRRGTKGFPAPDEAVRDWFLESRTRLESFKRASAFLCALFTTLLDYLQNLDKKVVDANLPPAASLAGKFRLLMTVGQSFFEQGPLRRKFYDDVLNLARRLWSLPEPSGSKKAMSFPLTQGSEYSLNHRLGDLIKYLDGVQPVVRNGEPAVILSFDEAHSLADIVTDKVNGGIWSNSTELRRVLRAIHFYPCASIFLSTAREAHQSVQPTPGPREDISSRLMTGHLNLLPPFCQLGFDQFAEKVIIGRTTLDDVSSVSFMAKLGRPLFASRYLEGDQYVKDMIIMFAIEKLLGGRPFRPTEDLDEVQKVACMAVRLPFEFDRMSLSARALQSTLVEKHMRVCLSIDSESETAITIAPSEPLLAEASYVLMREERFNLPRCLKEQLAGTWLNKEDRGQLVAMALCLQARDRAVQKLRDTVIPVVDFIQELLATEVQGDVLRLTPAVARSDKDSETLEDTFRDSKLYFSHFIKLRDRRMINRKLLLLLLIRGAAGCFVDGQDGIDVIVPLQYKDRVLGHETLAALFIQVKNDAEYTTHMRKHLFDKMNPYTAGFFDQDEPHPVPIIRMVFALASSSPGVEVRMAPKKKRSLRNQDKTEQPPNDMQPDSRKRFTAFDIWCAGISDKTFKPIRTKDDVDMYRESLLHSVFPGVYESKRLGTIGNAMRNMNPATSMHRAHYERFIDASEYR